jgi:protein O-GlcNAc transferase
MLDPRRHARQLHADGETIAAEAHYLQAREQYPHDLDLEHDYAVLLMQTRRERQAIPLFEALRMRRDSIDSTLALLVCLRAVGDIGRGAHVAADAVRLAPGNPVAWLLQGSFEVIAGRPIDAEPPLRRCLALAPELDEGWHYLGEALQAQRRWDEAIAAYRRSMRSQPGEVFNIALCCERSGRWRHAIEGYRRMSALQPDRVDVMLRLAQAEAMCCLFEEEAHTVARVSSRLSSTAASLPVEDRPDAFPLSFLPIEEEAKARLLQRHAEAICSRARSAASGSVASTRGTGKVLRIGYLSADFGKHAVGSLLQDLFAAHDRSVVQVHAYSLQSHDDEVAERIRSGADHFHDVSMLGHAALADALRGDALDVLVDLGGYTQGARPEALALRPARVQLGWLGFIHGHQAPWLDGLILDHELQPTGASWPYSDRIFRLESPVFPGLFHAPAWPDRARFGLPEGVPLLASFNSSYKLDHALLLAWVEILKRATDAWLLVCIPEHARTGFDAAWTKAGGASRLLYGDHIPLAAQADRAASCDLFLDAFRYQAGATAMGSLAAGLPLLTRTGHTAMARAGTSLNRYLGMHALVCGDTEDYIDKAVSLANSRHAMDATRQQLRQALSSTDLFSPRRSAAALESLFVQVAR